VLCQSFLRVLLSTVHRSSSLSYPFDVTLPWNDIILCTVIHDSKKTSYFICVTYVTKQISNSLTRPCHGSIPGQLMWDL
jgi:hypothetical protein